MRDAGSTKMEFSSSGSEGAREGNASRGSRRGQVNGVGDKSPSGKYISCSNLCSPHGQPQGGYRARETSENLRWQPRHPEEPRTALPHSQQAAQGTRRPQALAALPLGCFAFSRAIESQSSNRLSGGSSSAGLPWFLLPRCPSLPFPRPPSIFSSPSQLQGAFLSPPLSPPTLLFLHRPQRRSRPTCTASLTRAI